MYGGLLGRRSMFCDHSLDCFTERYINNERFCARLNFPGDNDGLGCLRDDVHNGASYHYEGFGEGVAR